jgi:predicted nucleotidyltransferase
MTLALSSIIQTRRDDILRIATEHGASNIRVFGSVARGEEEPESDIDLLIQLESGRSLLDLIAIKQELEALLGRSVDVLTEAAISPYLREQILSEAVRL